MDEKGKRKMTKIGSMINCHSVMKKAMLETTGGRVNQVGEKEKKCDNVY